MSVIEEAVCKILKDAAGVAAIVSTRIYPQVIPQGGTMPAITYQRISGPRLRSLAGASTLAHPRFQINCWATTYKGASQLEDAVRAAFDDYLGTVLSVGIQAVDLQDDGDMLEVAEEQRDRRRFGRRMDFEIWHVES